MKLFTQRLPFLPVTAFAMVMGITGLSIAFGKFYHLQWLPKAPFASTLFLGLGVFIFLSVFYAAKTAFFFDEVRKEFNHPVRMNFLRRFPSHCSCWRLGFTLIGRFWPWVSGGQARSCKLSWP